MVLPLSCFLCLLLCLIAPQTIHSFSPYPATFNSTTKTTEVCSEKEMTTKKNFPCNEGGSDMNGAVDPSILPGDPSLNLVTNVDLRDKKLDVMKACSKAICEATGKPESYIAVTITDNASMIFGGTDDPTALGNMYSIGAISMENNGAVQNSITDILEPFGVAANRMYINFFDIERQNCGWNRKTFAG